MAVCRMRISCKGALLLAAVDLFYFTCGIELLLVVSDDQASTEQC